jgi:hypothetical protein
MLICNKGEVEDMKNFIKSSLCYLFVISLIGCHRLEASPIQELESPTPSIDFPAIKISSDEKPNIEDIMHVFRFLVNKNVWIYGKSIYMGSQMTAEIYYEEINQLGKNGYVGYLFFPFQKNEKTWYNKVSVFIGKEGFESDFFQEDETRKIDDKLIYLGQETFCFMKEDVKKPIFPTSSTKKQDFLEKAKKKITQRINSYEKPSKGEYKVYIENFTNQDISANVIILKNNEEAYRVEVFSEMVMDDGTVSKDIVHYFGVRSPPRNWNNKLERSDYEKRMQLSICEFTVVNP